MKPLGIKNYGSIGHLPGSRLGPGDHSLNPGQDRIATAKARDKHDRVIVQEKLDGSNVGVAKVNGVILPLQRSGYHANSSPFEQHRLFAGWVSRNYERFDALLPEGERVCGEWLAQAHGTRYRLTHEPFVAFDLMVGTLRAPYEEFTRRTAGLFVVPKVLSVGSPVGIEAVLALLGDHGHHGAVDLAEGAVWRVERKGKVDFLCKYVRPGKVDGVYLDSISKLPPVWNWHPTTEGV